VNQLADLERLPRLSGERMLITAFFSDIKGFSTFSEKFKDDPEGLVAILNTYLTRVSAVLQAHGACLDKYIGDAIVCIFGAPVRHDDHAIRACQAALAAKAEVEALRREFTARGMPDVTTRMGLNSAVMFVGNIGSAQLFNYTAIGDGMNLAARLEGANKNYGTSILVGPQTYELAGAHFEMRELDWVRVAGKTEAVPVYELLAARGELSESKKQVVALYQEALSLYRKARFMDAVSCLELALAVDAGDGPSTALLERCRRLSQHPPVMPFDGVVNLEK
jgi:adenylate cyclase